MDHEDLIKLAVKIDREGAKVEFDPSEVADSSKESGDYQKKHHIPESEIDDDEYQTFDTTLVRDERESSVSEIFDKSLKEKPPVAPPVVDKLAAKKEVDFNKLFEVPDHDESQVLEERPVEDDGYVIPEITFPEDSVSDSVKKSSSENDDVTDEELENLKHENVEAELKEEPVEVAPPKDVKKEIIPLVESARKDIENMLIQKTTLAKSVRRVQTKKVFTLKKDATPTLMFNVLRNDSNDCYRIMMSVIEENKVKHQFFVDRQVLNQFSHKEKAMLGIESVDDWNRQPEVRDPDRFDLEVMEFLENFQPCQFPVHSICWKKDAEVIKRFLKPCKYMIDNPQVYEDIFQNNFGLTYDRQDMLDQFGVTVPKNPSIYTPIDLDFIIWTELN